ncbi:hypothetical protein N665_0030s0079 [Sinapis alba]|nr:hypothetical protein N665_0030s0079 [Sinapis alba]
MEKREIYSLVLMVVFMMGMSSDGMLVATAKDEVSARVISPKEWDRLVLKSKLPVIILYTTIPCTKSSDKRYVETCRVNQEDLNRLAKDLKGSINVYKIDIDAYPWFKPTAIRYGMNEKESGALINGGKLEGNWTSWPNGLEDVRPDDAIQLYTDACEILEEDGKDQLAFDLIDAFLKSDQNRTASRLLTAYNEGDIEEIKKVASSRTVSNLDHSFIKLARKLPTGDVTAIQMNTGEDLDEDDLT